MKFKNKGHFTQRHWDKEPCTPHPHFFSIIRHVDYADNILICTPEQVSLRISRFRQLAVSPGSSWSSCGNNKFSMPEMMPGLWVPTPAGVCLSSVVRKAEPPAAGTAAGAGSGLLLPSAPAHSTLKLCHSTCQRLSYPFYSYWPLSASCGLCIGLLFITCLLCSVALGDTFTSFSLSLNDSSLFFYCSRTFPFIVQFKCPPHALPMLSLNW